MAFPLERATPASLDLDPKALERLLEAVTRHIAEGRYPGAQIAMARRGKLALFETIGDARIDPARAQASEDTLWLLYSNTKVVTACAVWLLVERGALSFTDKVAEHLPGFEQNGKGDITIIQLLTHQGGFPNAQMPKAAWADHDLMRRTVCAFTLEWTPGSRVHYHGLAAHWTAAAMIEALTKSDYRDFIRANVAEPLGLGNELFVGPARPFRRHARARGRQRPTGKARG
jgi:CubicO group peptidase (beta-lactamase class C family)